MKWLILLLIGMAPLTLQCQIIYSQDFEAFPSGTRIAAADSLHWRTSNNLPGSPEDAPVTDSIAHGGHNSLAFIQTIPNIVGGPTNVALLLGYRVNGSYVLSWSMFIPVDRGASIVLLHGESTSSSAPAAVIAFLPQTIDTVTCNVAGTSIGGYFPRNTWFTVTLAIDLDDRTASFVVNNTLIGTWDFDTMPSGTTAPNTLGAVQFIAGSGWDFSYGEYYIDDILFQEGSVGIAELETPRPLSIYPNPTAGGAELAVEMPLSQAQVEVHDASGRVVLRMPWSAGQTRLSLPAGALAPGAYVVRVASRSSATARASAIAVGHQGPGAETLMELSTGRLVVMP